MKPGPRRSVSQVDIVDAAFEILEQKGFAAVSVRGVAAALGLTPTAIYTYFPSKNALLRAMVEELLSSLDLAAACRHRRRLARAGARARRRAARPHRRARGRDGARHERPARRPVTRSD